MINIFNALKNFFYKLFGKNNTKLLEAGKTEEIKTERIQETENKSEKEKFFDIYEKVLNQEIDLNSLSEDDMKKIYVMLQEENNLRKKNNEELEKENRSKKIEYERKKAELENLKKTQF